MKNETTQPSTTEQAIAKIEFTDVKAFESIVAVISGLADKYRGLKITDTASYKVIVSGIAEIRNLRISVEERRKEKKADILAAGRQIDSGAKQIVELLWPIENDLKTTKKAEDDKKALIKAEKDKLEKERIEIIQTKIAAFPPDMFRLPQLLKMTAPEIQEMQNALAEVKIDIEVYQEFTPEAIKTKGEKAKLLQEYYIARITADAKEKKRQAEAIKAEQAKKEQEAKEEAFKKEQEQLEAERLAKVEAQRIVDEKVRKEQKQALKKQEEEQRAKQKIEDNRLDKIRKEQEAETEKLRITQAEIETQKQALQEEYDRLENERLERDRIEQEKQAKIERDKTAKAEAEEQERLRVEQKAIEEVERKRIEAEEKKRQENLRPDKEALELYVSAIQKAYIAIEEPLMKNPAGNIALAQIQANFEKMFDDTLDVIEDM